jgi:hypothetical protein
MVADDKWRRLEWLWHVIRMQQRCLHFYLCKLVEGTTVENPRFKRLDDIENGLRELTVKRWRQTENNEEDWIDSVERGSRFLEVFRSKE